MEIGILGAGSYSVRALEDREVDVVGTPFGDQAIERGTISGVSVVWVRRFGWTDSRPSHTVNHRRQMMTFRKLGIRRVFTLNGFGGVNPEFAVGDLVVAHDYIKLLERIPPTIFGPGTGWPRVDMGAAVGGPYCPEIRQVLAEAARRSSNRRLWERAVNICVQGPHLETEAEIEMVRRMGADLVSTTIWPEVVYARELGICFASLCWVSDAAGQLSTQNWKMIPADELNKILQLAVTLITKKASCQCQEHWREEAAHRGEVNYSYE